MTVRKYEQRLRAENAEETRRRILDAFAEQLGRAPTEPVSLDQVARRARVARSTIYTAFGSRAGLFDPCGGALRSGTGRPSRAPGVGPPEAHARLRGGMWGAARMCAADLPVYRVLFSLGRLDPDAIGGA